MQRPSIGRIVHYQPRQPAAKFKEQPASPQAAIVSAVEENSGLVTLTVFPPLAAPFSVNDVAFSEQPKPNCWSWPPQVPAQDPPKK
jgi:hypothetical protein